MTDIKVDEQGIEYYSPDLGNAKPLKIPDRKAEEVDDFETKLDEKVIFQRVAKELYKYPTSAIRELLVNAIGHGAKKANVHYGKDNGAYVEIKLHPHEKSLVITDVRGMGMTHQQIKSLMSYVGRSGNMDSETAGQFGMGYFSHLKIADSCIIQTKVREPYEYQGNMITSMSYLNNKGWQWQRINKNDEDIDLEEPGTSISLTLNNDITINDVINTIRSVAKYSDIVVKLILGDDYGRLVAGDINIDQTSDLSTIHPITEEQETIILDDEDVYFKAVMIKDKYGNMSHDGEKVMLLARVPITVDDTTMIPHFTGWVLNIKNERKFMPQPDRERLSMKSETALKTKLNELFKTHFESLKATNAEELESLKYKFPVLFMRQLGVEKYFTKATKDFIGSLVDHTVKHIIYDEAKVSTDYGASHNLLQVLAYRKNALIVFNKSIAPIIAVTKYCNEHKIPKKQYIRIDLEKTSKIALDLLEQWKIQKIKDFMVTNKIKSKAGKHVTGLTLHSHPSHSRQSTKITNFDDIDFSRTIWVKGALKPWLKVFHAEKSSLFMTKYLKTSQKYAEDNDEPFITEATLYGLKDINIITSKGRNTFVKWYRLNKSILHSGYSNNYIKKFEASPNEVAKTKQLEQALATQNNNTRSYGESVSHDIDCAMVMLNSDDATVIHDVNGTPIVLPYENNYMFLLNLYEQIQSNVVLRTDIKSQLSIITTPNKTEKYDTVEKLFNTSPIYKEGMIIGNYGGTEMNITDLESWKLYDLNFVPFFGIPNVYESKYGWRDGIDFMYAIMDAIKNTVKELDTQQMLFRGITHTDYDSFCTAIGTHSYGNDKRTDAQMVVFKQKIQTIVNEIAKLIPIINANDSFDVFIKTRHALNNIDKKLLESQSNHKNNAIISSVQSVIDNVNSQVSITGKFTEFINEFLPRSECIITETNNTTTIMCNPSEMIKVKTIVELHSNMQFSDLKIDGEKSILVFHSYEKPSYHDYWETKNTCPCGCKNNSTLRITKMNKNET